MVIGGINCSVAETLQWSIDTRLDPWPHPVRAGIGWVG